MPLKRLTFAPGIVKDITDYSAEGTWVDGDKVRFLNGYARTIGGWTRVTNAGNPNGTPRCLWPFTANDGENLIAVGSNRKLLLLRGGDYLDITPIRKTVNPMANNPFATVNGSSVVTVTDVGHGMPPTGDTDYVIFSGATLFNNVLVSGEYLVTQVVDADHYKITVTTVANATGSGGGALVVVQYEIHTGLDTSVLGTGWGSGAWSSGPWGGPSGTASFVNDLRVWHMDSWGEDLITNIRDDIIIYWQRSTGFTSRAINLTAIGGATDVPVVARQIIVANSARHLIALGCNEIGSGTQDKMLVRWCSRENLADWTPTSINTAGEIPLTGGSEIIGGATARGEIIIWTDQTVWTMQFVGGEDVFGFTQISGNAPLLAPNLHAFANNTLFWMSPSGFYAYDGVVRIIPSPVQQYVLANMNATQTKKCFACTNSRYHEIWFFYVSTIDDLNNDEIDRYVIYNWQDNTWSVGSLDRTAWVEPSFSTFPVVGSPTPQLFYQENGFSDETGVALEAFIESADLDISDGQHMVLINRIIPDLRFLDGNPSSQVLLSIWVKDFPSQDPVTYATQSTFNAVSREDWVRARGRQARLRYSTDTSGMAQSTAWQLGATRLDVQMDGMQ